MVTAEANGPVARSLKCTVGAPEKLWPRSAPYLDSSQSCDLNIQAAVAIGGVKTPGPAVILPVVAVPELEISARRAPGNHCVDSKCDISAITRRLAARANCPTLNLARVDVSCVRNCSQAHCSHPIRDARRGIEVVQVQIASPGRIVVWLVPVLDGTGMIAFLQGLATPSRVDTLVTVEVASRNSLLRLGFGGGGDNEIVGGES